MKKLVLILSFLLLTSVAHAKKSCPEGYKETINKWGYKSGQCYMDTDTDTDTNTHANAKDQTDMKVKIGLEAENVITNLPFDSRMDVAYKKDVNKTNAKEGHEVEFMVVKRFSGIDAGLFNPFNWFK